jgi:hypothetical protein
VAERLDVRQSCRRALGRLAPVRQRAINQPRFGVVVRQQLRLGLGNFRKPACENLGEAFVQLAPSCVQDRLKGRVADQRMLEDVARLRWRAPLSKLCFGVE